MGPKAGPCPHPGCLCPQPQREPQVFPMHMGQGLTCPASLHVSQELLGPGIKAQSLCFSLQSVSPAGTSRLRMGRGISGPLIPWQSTQPEPHLRTSQQPFNTDMVSKKTHRLAHRGLLSKMQCTVPRGRGTWVVMSLGELRCSQVGTRPGGAIQGH